MTRAITLLFVSLFVVSAINAAIILGNFSPPNLVMIPGILVPLLQCVIITFSSSEIINEATNQRSHAKYWKGEFDSADRALKRIKKFVREEGVQ